MIKAIIFDCFGVVYQSRLNVFLDNYFPVASRGDEREAFLEVVRAYDRAMVTKRELLGQAIEMAGVPLKEAEIALFTGFTVNQPVMDYVRDIKGSHKTGLLTNIGRSTLTMLEPHLKSYFNVIIASCATGVAKPDPEAYLIAAKMLAVEPGECVFVDDQEKQCAGAAAVGMKPVLYSSLEQMKREVQSILYPK